MSSQSDRVAFDNSVQPYDETILFKQKNWTYITDSSSSGGVFNNQLQFDLNTLSSQSQWVDLSEAYVQFPVRVKIKNTGSTSGTLTPSINATVLKNGFHHFVDSVQVVLDGSTVQASQIYENISTTFKIMSEWSQDELRKYGPSLGIALDDYTDIDNTAIDTLTTAATGINMSLASANSGIAARQSIQNIKVASGAVSSILSTQAKNIGKPSVAVSAATTAVAVGSHSYTQFVLATIRLKDISPVLASMPMSRNLKGFLYINYNSSTTTFSTAVTTGLPSAVSTAATAGRCCPMMLRSDLIVAAQYGGVATTWEVACELSGVSTELTTAIAPITYGRLVAPYFVANPAVDAALSMKKTFRYLERNVSTFDIAAGANTTVTLSPGIANPKRVLLYPYFTGGITNLLSNPLLSPFDSSPATTSPFAALKDLQILVANQPMFQNPVSMDWDQFSQEVAQQGLDGGLDSQSASGLLSQQMWDRLYRFYTCDVGRRLESEDGSSKSVIVQCTNATLANMRVIAMIFYEKEITVDTSMGRVYQGKA